MRRLLLLALVFAGCSSPAVMVEEAEPHAADALVSLRGLQQYLLASGVEIASTYRLVLQDQPGLVRGSGFNFNNGGRCSILTYDTPNTALQLGPKTEGDRTGAYLPGGNFMGSSEPDRRQEYKPTIQFGSNVAVCRNEDPRVKRALKALAAYAEANPAPLQSEDE